MRQPFRYTITFIILSVIALNLNAQPGYNIAFSCAGLEKQTIKLAYHLGIAQYLKDSLITDEKGKCVFKGKEKLAPGVYMFVLPGNKYFEFLVEDRQDFSASCNFKPSTDEALNESKDKQAEGKWKNYEITAIKFKGSVLNDNFLSYESSWQSLQQKYADMKREFLDAKDKPDEQAKIKQSIIDQEMKMKLWLTSQSEINNGTLLGAIIKSIIPVNIDIPEVPSSVSNPDSVKKFWSYLYYKNHFFDNTELSNPGLIRSPVLATKLDQFFTQVVIQSPDSIIKETDKLLKKCQSQKEVFQYVTSWIFNKYASSQYMGHDAIVVHIADSVYLAGKAPWVSNEFIADLAKKVNRLRPNLIGVKATDLVMNSYTGNFVALYDVRADFTILYFWEPDCGHCKEATPKLKDYYNRNKDKGIEVFAVCTKDNKADWEKYITEHDLTWINGWDPDRLSHFDFFYNVESTPLVYILDKDKKIIAKKISVEDIGPFIESYREYQTSAGIKIAR
jgi:thiol-disulfide isomerase/thioredoxin